MVGQILDSNSEEAKETSHVRYPAGDSDKSFRKTSTDHVTGKSITWVAAGKENGRTLSCIVAVKNTPYPKFGKVLYFVNNGMDEEAFAHQSVCIAIFSVSAQDKPSGFCWINTTSLDEKVVAVDCISKPLVTAKNNGDPYYLQ